jgi:hypothetical protein
MHKTPRNYLYNKKYIQKCYNKTKEERPHVYRERYEKAKNSLRDNYDDEQKEKKRLYYLKNKNYRLEISGNDMISLFRE